MASYGKYRHTQIAGEMGTTWNVEVWKKDFVAPSVGDEIGGGVVFKVTATNVYVSALEDLGNYEWGCYGTDINGDNSSVSPELDGIGTGLQNTLEIVAGCSSTPIAASEALAYESGGYSDWYLPSKDELLEMYNTIGNGGSQGDIGGFGNNWYWSSSEANRFGAWVVGFNSGAELTPGKGNNYKVRPIRSYSYDSFESTEMDLAGEGFEITWNGSGGTRDKTFLGSECDLKLMVQNDDEESFLYDVLDSGFKEYFIRIYKGSVHYLNLWWFGWIQPAFDVVENAPYPYISSITATDSSGYYKELQFKTFIDETYKQSNYSLCNVFKDFIGGSDVAPVNLVENSTFMDDSSRGWVLLEGDEVIGQNRLSIAGATTSGTRRPLSCDGDVLKVGDTYKVFVECTAYTSGTLYVKNGGGSSTTIGSVNSEDEFDFEWTQTDNGSDGNGLHFYTTNFIGEIGNVVCYTTEGTPRGSIGNFMKVNNQWETSEFLGGVSPCGQFYLCKGGFANNTNFPLEYKESDVFKESLKVFNTIGMLAKGAYYFLQPNSYFDGGSTYSMDYSPFDKETTHPTTLEEVNEENVVTIDQSNHYLLGGASFTYEAPFKSCTATFTSVGAAFTLAQGDDITDYPGDLTSEDYTYGGQMTADTTYDLDWFSRYESSQPQSNLTITSGWVMDQRQQCFDYYITIKAVSSLTTKYLTLNADQELEWNASSNQLVLSRGKLRTPADGLDNSLFYSGFNENSCVGAWRNVAGSYANPADITRYSDADSKYTFDSDLLFLCQLPQLAETSSIFVKVHTIQRFFQDRATQSWQQIFPTNGLLIDVNSYVEDITLTARETNSLVTNEFRVVEYADEESTAIEDFNLGSVTIGVSSSNPEHSITYRDNEPMTDNVYRGTDTAGEEAFTQFLVKQFLEPQQTPLKILQGSIQSNDISPIDVVKYSYNGDGNYEHFMFMGGTFKAQSEIIGGEWFRLKDD